MFHELLLVQYENKTLPASPLRYKLFPSNSPGFYESFVNSLVNSGIEYHRIVLLASEELSLNATAVWGKILSNTQLGNMASTLHPKLRFFDSIRVNTGRYHLSLSGCTYRWFVCLFFVYVI